MEKSMALRTGVSANFGTAFSLDAEKEGGTWRMIECERNNDQTDPTTKRRGREGVRD